ncbi:hypothetical protein BCV70DRAFT_5937 [Testicularia cyperi]|uniref:GAR domain-containing protein n=1 Tax=Testicularia cyperi TaxID=1882483 RepID=A0A317XZR7_9BASI|nr:hypothetical protein BCV70DRAFT_5937 [Testicularia cyperi]
MNKGAASSSTETAELTKTQREGLSEVETLHEEALDVSVNGLYARKQVGGMGATDTVAAPPATDLLLSSRDLIELTSFSQKKVDIEEQTGVVQAWPQLDPFKNLQSYRADEATLRQNREGLAAFREELLHYQVERMRHEAEAQRFNVQDMNRLRLVAKATSKRHLSAADTDLIELTLDTLYALDRLLRLLRARRVEHDISELRLKWELMLCACWEDLPSLQDEAAAFEQRCNEFTRVCDHRGRLSVLRPPDLRSESALTPAAKSKRRFPSGRMALEALKLESSRLVLRIKSFTTERVLPTGRVLDQMIDQRQIPEKLIDEQERLEDSIPKAATIEALVTRLCAEAPAHSATTVESSAFSKPSLQESSDKQQPEKVVPNPSLRSVDAIWPQLDTKCAPPGIRERVSELPCTELGDSTVSTPRRSALVKLKTPSRSRASREERVKGCDARFLPSTPSNARSSRPNRYRPDPEDQLDVAVSAIINDLPMKVSIQPVRLADIPLAKQQNGHTDQSGRYWVGDPEPRLCFCRILRSNTVMVRVGGGWQELSQFITHHYAHLNDVTVTPTASASGSRSASIGSTPTTQWLRSASGSADPLMLRTQRSSQALRAQTSRALSTEWHSGPLPPTQYGKVIRVGDLDTTAATKDSSVADLLLNMQRLRASPSTPVSELSLSESASSIVMDGELLHGEDYSIADRGRTTQEAPM